MGGGAMLTPMAGGVIGGPPPDSFNNNNNIQSQTPNINLQSHLNFSSNSTVLPSSYLAETTPNYHRLDSLPNNKITLEEDRRRSIGSYYYDNNTNNVLAPVPSRIEVQKAISDLHRYMHGLSTSKPEFSWLQQMLNHQDPRMLQSPGYRRVYDAYRLLQTDPSVQRMVASISSDKVVWDAILKNQAVQDLHSSLYTANSERDESSNEESDLATLILKWILGMAKSMIGELMEKFASLVNDIFQQKPASELTDHMEEKLISSLLLSVVILVIVVVGRSGGV
ncbi:hypothetical protein LguiB_023528 [Lonicera macranthoides]